MNHQSLNPQVWILAGGRLLLQFGTGFTLFYTPLFFVNELDFSPTMVGIALGSASVSGIIGRFWGGSWSDSQRWGRKKTLLLSALISAVADVFLILTDNYSFLLWGNLLMGLGIGLYWPAAEAVVADLTRENQRNSAFALSRLGDSIGLGLGVAIGGWLIAVTNNYRLLFIVDGFSFIVFYGIIRFTIQESYRLQGKECTDTWQNWQKALSDRKLLVFCLINILFTTYVSQIQSTLPLYLTNFTNSDRFSITNLSGLFSLHIAFAALFQLPVVKILNRLTHLNGLMLSALIWGLTFVLVWLTGNVSDSAFFWGLLAVLVGAIALTTYNPAASAFVVDISPDSLRGIYFAINSQCWAIGYLIGPPLGGWVLDRGEIYAHNFWLILTFSVAIALVTLQYLKQLIIGN